MDSCHNQTTGLTRVIPFVMDKVASGVRLTLLYISSEAVIPAKAGIQLKRLDSGSSPE
jgi:hypothetical protein